MKPEEIEVGAVYEGHGGVMRMVLGVRSGKTIYLDYMVVGINGHYFDGGKSMSTRKGFAKWIKAKVESK